MDECFKRKLQNPAFRAAYDAEDKRIELVLQIIKLREQARDDAGGKLAKPSAPGRPMSAASNALTPT